MGPFDSLNPDTIPDTGLPVSEGDTMTVELTVEVGSDPVTAGSGSFLQI